MKIDYLSLYNYRGYHKQDIEFSSGVNLLIGNNGSGKTNLLESIYFLSLAKSYKTDDGNLIKFDQDFSRINAFFSFGNLKTEIKVVISKNKKKIILNGREISKLSDYIGQINVVSFLPEDMNLIKGPPKDRRYFIDSIIGQMDRNYLIELLTYKNHLKQRNELIKSLAEDSSPDLTLLDIYTEQVASSGEKIIQYRKSFIELLNENLNNIYPDLSGNHQSFEFIYTPSVEKDLEDFLKKHYRKDLFIKTTSSGPHRDDYAYFINSIDAKDIASQGEQRVLLLSVLLAISEIFMKRKNKKPILLLDDVFSELDSSRQNKLIHFLNNSKLQTIITTTSTNNIRQEILDESMIFNVNNHFIRRN